MGGSSSVAIVDFISDGRPDLASVHRAGGSVSADLGAAGGGFESAPDVFVNSDPALVVVADFNADGDDDLAITNHPYRHVDVRLGNGDGTFERAAKVELTRTPWSLVVGDFNGDNISNANGFQVTGKLSGQTTRKLAVLRKRRIKLKLESFRVGAHAKKTVNLRLTAKVEDPGRTHPQHQQDGQAEAEGEARAESMRRSNVGREVTAWPSRRDRP
jgi:hypothetical protein